ncbi:SDR family oxidoreductase [Nocardioides sp. Bht2]|uniref:SDR family oxidoreductase n=1 Tax=Nocardioides sp. Bht2 TaxID=3392297 RepID=UPI0039B55CFB
MSRYPAVSLSGASVAITGAAQGIGRATAEALAARGAQVAIGDLDLALAERTAAAIGGTAHRLDVRDRDAFAAFIAAAEAAHGPLEVLVNNAGVMPNGGFLEIDDATNQLIMDVNVGGVVNGMQVALPGMLSRGRGHIVNVASLVGKFPVPGLAMYTASKFAVVGLTAATRREYADSGVSLTAILPSAVDTALASGLDMKPLPKVQPSEIADAVVASIGSRKAEIAVPRYVGALSTFMAVIPSAAEEQLRRITKDDRALRTHGGERAAYAQRIEDQSRSM